MTLNNFKFIKKYDTKFNAGKLKKKFYFNEKKLKSPQKIHRKFPLKLEEFG